MKMAFTLQQLFGHNSIFAVTNVTLYSRYYRYTKI